MIGQLHYTIKTLSDLDLRSVGHMSVQYHMST